MTKKLFAIALITVFGASMAFAAVAPVTTSPSPDAKTVVKVKKHHKRASKKMDKTVTSTTLPATK